MDFKSQTPPPHHRPRSQLRPQPRPLTLSLALALALVSLRCAGGGVKSTDTSVPINNPFGKTFNPAAQIKDPLILRSRQGDRSWELEIPQNRRQPGDFAIPFAPAQAQGQPPKPSTFSSSLSQSDGASGNSTDGSAAEGTSYQGAQPGVSDREIVQELGRGSESLNMRRAAVEQELDLVTSDDSDPRVGQKSYLGDLDHIKQLFRAQRFEAALIETDLMIRTYQNDPKLHEMRGTLLSRLGKMELAIRSWQQSLHLNPKNEALKQFIQRANARLMSQSTVRNP